MPALVEIELERRGEQAPPVTPVRLHGAGCSLFGHSPKGTPPSFSAGPMVDHGTGVHWRLGWLGAARCPRRFDSVRIGPSTHRVVDVGVREFSFAQLAGGDTARYAEMDVVTPMYFSRNGRDDPLPDAVLAVGSLVERWNAWAPAETLIDDALAREVTSTVYVAGMAGHTEWDAVRPGQIQTGFVGTVGYALTAKAGATAAATFTALLRFAEIAGVGAGTGHGFGTVHVRLDDRPPRRRA